MTETVWPAKLKYTLFGLLQKTFPDLWSKGIRSFKDLTWVLKGE